MSGQSVTDISEKLVLAKPKMRSTVMYFGLINSHWQE